MSTTLNTIEVMRSRAKAAYGIDAASVGIVSSFGQKADVNPRRREITWIANTSDIDMEDEVVVPEGLDPSRYFDKNRAIFLDHRYETMYKIGMMRSRKLVDDAQMRKFWQVHAYIMPTELGNAVLAMAEEGGGMPCSIGFAAVDWGSPTKEETKRYSQRDIAPRTIVRKADWIELSATAIPMNVSCQGKLCGEPEPKSLSLIDSLVCKGRITRNAALAMGFKEAKKKHTASMYIPRHAATVTV